MQIAATRWIHPLASESHEHAFIRSVFLYMSLGLLLTTVAAASVAMSPALQHFIFVPGFMALLFIIELAMIVALSSFVERLSSFAAAATFIAYSIANGFTLSGIALAYTDTEIFQAFAVAAGMFAAVAIYGFIAKSDLTSWGTILFMGLTGVLLASLINIVLHSPALTLFINLFGVGVFLALTAWDTQKLKAFAARHESGTGAPIAAALALYLDLINLFVMTLQLIGWRRRRR